MIATSLTRNLSDCLRRYIRLVGAVLSAGRKKLSLVDCVSFGVMRAAGLRKAFAFDRQFVEQGFECGF
jgi:predicted nucleic acid-binding protein